MHNAIFFRSISTTTLGLSSMLFLDIPGLQQQQTPATFDDFCHNYLQERLQTFFNDVNVTKPCELYAQERIDLNLNAEIDILNNQTKMIDLLDKKIQLSKINHNTKSNERQGLLQILDEEFTTNEAFVQRVFAIYNKDDDENFLRKSPGNDEFILQHLQGTNPVLYVGNNWLKWCRGNRACLNVASILQKSTK